MLGDAQPGLRNQPIQQSENIEAMNRQNQAICAAISCNGGLFDILEHCLIGRRATQLYAALAAQLGMTEAAVKMALCRLRERYRACLKEEIAQTVASPAEVDEELRHLFRVLARG